MVAGGEAVAVAVVVEQGTVAQVGQGVLEGKGLGAQEVVFLVPPSWRPP